MTKNTIDRALYDTALDEAVRRKRMPREAAEQIFSHAWHSAVVVWNNYQALKLPPSHASEIASTESLQRLHPEDADYLRRLQQRLGADSARRQTETQEQLLSSNKQRLLQLFTMGDFLSQVTAQKIVDQIIAQE